MGNQPNNSDFSVQPYTADGVVNDSNVNIRNQPVTIGNSPVVEVGMGTKVSITGKVVTSGTPSEWYELNFNGQKAYIAQQYVTTPVSNVSNASGCGTILRVNWVSQFFDVHECDSDPDPKKSAFDACGPTSLLMVLQAYGFLSAVTSVVGMKPYIEICNETTAKQLSDAAQQIGLTLTSQQASTDTVLSTLKDYLTQCKPVIMLLDYLKLTEAPFNPPKYLKPGSTSVNHWWVVIGIDADKFVVNDPLWNNGDNSNNGGGSLRISAEDLQGAFLSSYDPNLLVTNVTLP